MLTAGEHARAQAILNELSKRDRVKLRRYYPDVGPYRRELYQKHLAFFAAGLTHRERLFLAANRVGKTEGCGSYEMTLHLTGEYPHWWEGRRFDGPIKAWASGDTSLTTRDIIQEKLLGPLDALRTGMIPGHLIETIVRKPGVQNAYETIFVKHAIGGLSTLQLKSYDQRRESFQGTAQHVVWLDEEPPEDIYTECLLRTAETSDFPGGMLMLTFTPLQGVTPLVLSFLPGGKLAA